MEIREETAVLVIYDQDCTLTKRHSEGAQFQRSFEKPAYAANLRAFSALKAHIQRLQASENPKVIFASATFGEFKERVVGSWQALGVDEASMHICAKFIDSNLAAFIGKNQHVAEIIQAHYRQNPHIKITQVILVDDDIANINALKKFSAYIQMAPWNGDQKFNVPVFGILAPQPVLELCQVKMVGKRNRQEILMHHDDELQMSVMTEKPASEARFLDCLKKVEEKILTKKPLSLSQGCRVLRWDFSLAVKRRLINPLTRSFDDTAMFDFNQKPRQSVFSLCDAGDAWGSMDSRSDDESEDNKSRNQTRRLCKSGPN